MSNDALGVGPGAALARTVGSGPAHRGGPAKEAAQRFEGLILSLLVKSAFSDESGGGLFGNGSGSHVYEGFVETYLGDHLARAGGLGLARTLERSLGGDVKP